MKLTLVNEENEKIKNVDINFEKIWQQYEEMSKNQKEDIEAKAYLNFLSDINQSDSRLNRAIFDKTKKNHIINIVKKLDNFEEIKVAEKISEIEEITEPKLTKSNEEETYKPIMKEFESLSMFLFEVMKELESKEIMDYQKIVQIIPVLGEFQGLLIEKKIRIKYNEGGESLISVEDTL